MDLSVINTTMGPLATGEVKPNFLGMDGKKVAIQKILYVDRILTRGKTKGQTVKDCFAVVDGVQYEIPDKMANRIQAHFVRVREYLTTATEQQLAKLNLKKGQGDFTIDVNIKVTKHVSTPTSGRSAGKTVTKSRLSIS